MQDAITANLNINVTNGTGPNLPNTGTAISQFFGAMPSFLPVIIGAVIIALVTLAIFLIIKNKRGAKMHSKSTRKLIHVAQVSSIMLAIFAVVIASISPKAAQAAESLIKISLPQELEAINVSKGDSEATANINLSIETASLNDLELKVNFSSQNSGIAISTTNNVVTLPAGTTSTSVPINISIADSVSVGQYTEPINISVEIEETFWRIEGRDVINRAGIATRLNAMNVGSNGIPGNWYDDATPNPAGELIALNDFTFGEFETLGINAIRYDFRARMIADDCTTAYCLTYDFRDEFFEKFDKFLEYADAHNVGVIFNMHNSYGTLTDGTGKWHTFEQDNLDKSTALWADIAAHFKDDKRVLGYDIMNEPMVQLSDSETIYDALDKWDVAAQDMIDAIRAVDPNHVIVVEKLNRGLRNNGDSHVGHNMYTTGKIFPDVTDPNDNMLFEFHDYGNWGYVTQDDDRVANEPWVWPNYDFNGIVNNAFVTVNESGSEVWPPARFRSNENPQDEWVTIESNNGAPFTIPPKDANTSYNLGSIAIVATGTVLDANSVYYIDDIAVDEYDSGNNYVKTVYSQTFRYSSAFNTIASGAVESTQDNCYDNEGNCYKMFGPTTGAVSVQPSWQHLRYFNLDPTKKYKVSAKVYGENIPAGASLRVAMFYHYGDETQVTPYDKSYLEAMVQPYLKYSIENNVAVFNGEYGVLKNGEVWDRIGGTQFVRDSVEVYKENNIHAAYFSYYDWNTNSRQRRPGLRIREYAMSAYETVTATNNTLNTSLYNLFLEQKD